MASVIELKSMIDPEAGYREVVEHVRDAGQWVAPRGKPTWDVGPTLIVIDEPTDSLAVGVGRRLSTSIAAVEAAMLVGGFCDEALVARVAPQLMRYADDTVITGDTVKRLHGAYGRRVREQLGHAIQKLRTDPHTRQAVITLWDPWLDNLPGMRDYPCTVALQLIRRRDRLDLHVTMRSSDVWRGLPYDVFQFSQLQLTAARLLGVDVGTYYHMAWSLHLYESDQAAVDEMLSSTSPMLQVDTEREESHFFQPQGFGRRGHTVADVQRRIQQLVIGRPMTLQIEGERERVLQPNFGDFTQSELWFARRLSPVLGGVTSDA